MASANVTSVASAATSTVLFAAGVQGTIGTRTIFNDSTAKLRVKFGTGASLTSFTNLVAPAGYWEIPETLYDGVIEGVWETANGFARLTEVTA